MRHRPAARQHCGTGPMTLTMRRADISDAALLAEFAARTFAATFGAENTADDLAAHLAASYGVVQQRSEIRNPDVITLLAEDDGRRAGYARRRWSSGGSTSTARGTAVAWRRS